MQFSRSTYSTPVSWPPRPGRLRDDARRPRRSPTTSVADGIAVASDLAEVVSRRPMYGSVTERRRSVTR
jgi:hypothetical protein